MKTREPLSVIETTLAHDVYRRSTTLLTDAAGNAPLTALRTLRDFIVANLHHHHETEDHILWATLATVDPEAARALEDLGFEHEQLDAALQTLAQVPLTEEVDRWALADAAAAVCDLVHTHMAHEEPILLPALRKHLSEQAWEDFARQVMATSPTEGAELMIGFLDQVAEPWQVDLVLRNLPEPARAALAAIRASAEQTLRLLASPTEQAGVSQPALR
ncbi:hemerythrin domain-containing protein [Catellatospora sp. NPDC049111]|jgi:hemerythrin-like domain-containing protein|uniref:hemerythrin domain-containing protein n=1 Tax=unclassified Catellatospora TaxID=2645785 RepID=UPI0033D0AC24